MKNRGSVEQERNDRLALLRLLEAAAMRLVEDLDGEEDPILRDWAAGVEMEAREFSAVPVVSEMGGR